MNGSGRPWPAWAMGLSLTLCTLGLHLCPGMNSMLNIDSGLYPLNGRTINADYLGVNLEFHRMEPAFARRPFTTWIIEGLDGISGMGEAPAFIVTQFTLLFISGLLLYRLVRSLGRPRREALLAMAAYHLSFTVLNGWFPPIYCYDEPLQYSALFLALEACIRRRWAWFTVSFTFALCVRESSLLLLPAFFLFFSDGAWRPRRWGTRSGFVRASAFALPVLLFALFLAAYVRYLGGQDLLRSDVAGRSGLFELNFADPPTTVETLVYFYLALGLPSAILLAMDGTQGRSGTLDPPYRGAFLLAVLLNTIVVLFCTKAREARLFALPLVFVWPFLGGILINGKELLRLDRLRSMFARWQYVVVFVLIFGLLALFVDRGWELGDGNASGNLWHEYFLVQSGVILLHLMGKHWARRHPTNASLVTDRSR